MSLVKATAEKFSTVWLFILFNVFVLLGFGTLTLMRVLNDAYAPLPFTIITIVPLGLALGVVFLFFVLLILCLRHKKRLQNFVACLVVLSLFELAFLGFMTAKAYQEPLRIHALEEREEIIAILKQANEKPSSFGIGNFILLSMTMKLRILQLQYKQVEGTATPENEQLRALARQEACKYLSNYSQYNSLIRVSYTFIENAKNSFVAGFTPADCAASPLAGQEKIAVNPPLVPPVKILPSAKGSVSEHVNGLQKSLDGLQESVKLFSREVERLKTKTLPAANPAHERQQ